MRISSIFRYIVDSDYRWDVKRRHGFLNNISDEVFLKKQYKIMMGTELNLDNPLTYTEKLNWLKLYDRKLIYSTLVDKATVKSYIKDKIGNQYIIPTIGVWDKFDDIEFDKLPNQFVMKCTHDSGTVLICRKKADFDLVSAKKIIEEGLSKNYYYSAREWPYCNVKPRIIVEKLIGDELGLTPLRDFKFYCFNGTPKLVHCGQNTVDKPSIDYYDIEFNHLPFKTREPLATVQPCKPEQYDKMIELSKTLAKEFQHIRVDFLECNGLIYVGELTMYPDAGYFPVQPREWDLIIGSWLKIDKR